ncbi:MAG TPA: hypothetical protein VJY39_01930 [Acidisphaera sp.]|nr:hypothetical protein [Acidisphaera sp.]
MDEPDPFVDGDHAPRSETDEERRRRIAQEAKLIAEALASASTGRTVSEEEMEAWIDSIGTNHELPPPHLNR